MTDDITPALTPEEWDLARTPEDGIDWVDGQLSYSSYYSGSARRADADRHRARLLALANFALAEGHPLKITREDAANIDRLLRLACTCGVVTTDDGRDWDRCQEGLPTLVAKLSALLPPE